MVETGHKTGPRSRRLDITVTTLAKSFAHEKMCMQLRTSLFVFLVTDGNRKQLYGRQNNPVEDTNCTKKMSRRKLAVIEYILHGILNSITEYQMYIIFF